MERLVAHGGAEIPGRELLRLRVFEQALHVWDIAVGIAGDTTMEPALCEYLLASTAAIERLREQGYYRTASTTQPVRSAQEQVLKATGRL
jgi:hypothetical protein